MISFMKNRLGNGVFCAVLVLALGACSFAPIGVDEFGVGTAEVLRSTHSGNGVPTVISRWNEVTETWDDTGVRAPADTIGMDNYGEGLMAWNTQGDLSIYSFDTASWEVIPGTGIDHVVSIDESFGSLAAYTADGGMYGYDMGLQSWDLKYEVTTDIVDIAFNGSMVFALYDDGTVRVLNFVGPNTVVITDLETFALDQGFTLTGWQSGVKKQFARFIGFVQGNTLWMDTHLPSAIEISPSSVQLPLQWSDVITATSDFASFTYYIRH